MLERIVGEGHADVRASVELDLARVERNEDHYDRARTALRSEEQTIERLAPAAGITLAGVPGAESNLPGGSPGGGGTSSATSAGLQRETHTRNFEVDHVSERRVATQGSVRRVTVAVVVDGVEGPHGVVPRGAEELQRLTALVRGAVGASEARGDVVTVESIPFQETLRAPAHTTPSRARATGVRAAPRGVVVGAVVVGVALAGVALASLRRRRRSSQEAAAATFVTLRAAEAPAAELPAEPTFESLRAEAHARAAQDPATAALVLRYWLGAEDRERSVQQPAA
jgi:flagellar M-ring protein FliF